MEDLEAVKSRHSVRAYNDTPIEKEKADVLKKLIDKINRENNLNFKLVLNEPKAFDCLLSARFEGVNNYIMLAGKKSDKLDEQIGYFGEMLVIEAQKLGLNTCWVALTFNKKMLKKEMEKGVKLICVLSLGYGKTQGQERKSKTIDEVNDVEGELPEWFKAGLECALLAPTAMNQQRFMFSLNGNEVSVKSLGGFYAAVDMGIIKYHFELGAGKDNFVWGESESD